MTKWIKLPKEHTAMKALSYQFEARLSKKLFLAMSFLMRVALFTNQTLCKINKIV